MKTIFDLIEKEKDNIKNVNVYEKGMSLWMFVSAIDEELRCMGKYRENEDGTMFSEEQHNFLCAFRESWFSMMEDYGIKPLFYKE